MKTAVVTGASGGIGLETARALLAARGNNFWLCINIFCVDNLKIGRRYYTDVTNPI